MKLGANIENGKVSFNVWAPNFDSLHLAIKQKAFPMIKDERGYFSVELDHIKEHDLYSYLLPDGQKRADPVSRSLPNGVFGQTEIIDPKSFKWNDEHWKGIDQNDLIFYECHVGTFTREGTFRALIEKLPYLRDLGITCLELMPIASFAGRCNWGYDGVSLYAPHHLYGGPNGLKELVNAAHQAGIAIALDVVYNHFGPEGAFHVGYGPYLTNRYKTPWGDALNYDGPYSQEIRHFILQNALYWISEYHIDILRLDALHAIFDFSAHHILKELSAEVKNLSEKLGRKIYLAGESDRNDSNLIRPQKSGGQGLDLWWAEDFHHSLHVLLTHEKQGYYQDFHKKDIDDALKEGVVYQGKYSPYRKYIVGNSFEGIDPNQLIIFSQNHDQVGNRPFGNRLSTQISFEEQKIAALLVLFSPYIPLLFMGEEYGEKNPFEYFVDYDNPELMQAIYEGRKKEFNLVESLPIPNFEAFERSKLSWEKNEGLLTLYQTLIKLRSQFSRKIKKVQADETSLLWQYDELTVFISFAERSKEIPSSPFLLHTEERRFGGKGDPKGIFGAIFK